MRISRGGSLKILPLELAYTDEMILVRKVFSIIALLSFALIFLSPTSAQAHAELRSSDPADGAVLASMPDSISLTFGEDLLQLGDEEISKTLLTGPGGENIRLGALTVAGAILTVQVNEDEGSEGYEPGSYTLDYRVVSGDGHPVTGAISFEINAANETPAAEKTPFAITGNGGGDDDGDSEGGEFLQSEFGTGSIFIGIGAVIALAAVLWYLIRKRNE